jgi:hypothetical protein
MEIRAGCGFESFQDASIDLSTAEYELSEVFIRRHKQQTHSS